MRDETQIERAIARAFRPQRRLSRRMFLRQTGRGAVIAGSALSLPAILAACGIGPGASTAPSAGSQAALLCATDESQVVWTPWAPGWETRCWARVADGAKRRRPGLWSATRL